jgi:hypothetical protein
LGCNKTGERRGRDHIAFRTCASICLEYNLLKVRDFSRLLLFLEIPMSDQLEAEVQTSNDSFVIEGEVQPEESTEPQVVEQSATPTEPEPEKKPDITPEAQKIIAEKAFKEREARREAEDLRKRIDELEKANAPSAPNEPQLPDRWDFDSDEAYAQAVNDYADKKAEVRAYQVQQEALEQQAQAQARQAQTEREQAEAKVVQAYVDRANKLGLSSEDLQLAGNTVAAYGLKSDVVDALLSDEMGPLMVKYLSANPQAIESLNAATFATGATLLGQVRDAASALKPKTSSDAPPPPELISGGSVPQDENPWGATFE